ncbi:nucleoplasmin-like protein ANO39 [Homarus americanus]|uniref:Nucleoplasmin-like protein ANO39-like n=1 Tax=Homarus americanus TaxID=6706 RepID=A0A8J5JWY4_HOMAM|nr:nucleoplasmin-like protein ANO39 [Homarus americanus]KAG7165241.1 Nucleoplasmin-like protein ANO39-like [Homarus americanus]
MRGGMEKSYFWGITLDAAHREQKWEGTATENTVDCTVTTHTLSVRQVVLGPDADNVPNVVELEVLGHNDKKLKIPICVSKAGSSYVTNVEVLIEDQVATFHLTKGSGPVYISGTHQTETSVIGEDDMDDLAEEEGEDDEEEDEVEDSPPKKKTKK